MVLSTLGLALYYNKESTTRLCMPDLYGKTRETNAERMDMGSHRVTFTAKRHDNTVLERLACTTVSRSNGLDQ